jgi:hypothetical protein
LESQSEKEMRKTAQSTSSHSEAVASESIHNPTKNGYLFTRGYFNRWRKIWVDLSNHVLTFRMMKGGIAKRTVKLLPNTLCEESTVRPFCFSLSTPGTNETILLAADNVTNKETWVDSIQSSLYLLRLSDRKLRDKDKKKFHEEAVKQYITRPKIFVKVIQAKNLTPKDANGYSDPYVKVTLGASTVRTTTRKKNLNPEWGMVFGFDWEMTMRYAVVEVWDEDFSSADDFLGTVYVPVFSFYDGYNSKEWYPLCKRSAKSTISGEIEIEISCQGQPDHDLFAWQFFYEVQKLPEFSFQLAAQEDGSGQIGLKNAFLRGDFADINIASTRTSELLRPSTDSVLSTSLTTTNIPGMAPEENSAVPSAVKEALGDLPTLYGFPLGYPSIENEILEDVSFSCEILLTAGNQHLSMDGVLLLTSYRLIFITHRRILSERNTAAAAAMNNNSNNNKDAALPPLPPQPVSVNTDTATDLSFQLPIAFIVQAQLSSVNDAVDQKIAYDTINIRTHDCRNISFLFKDDSAVVANLPQIMNKNNILKKGLDLFSRGGGDRNAEMMLKRRPTNTGANLTLNNPDSVPASGKSFAETSRSTENTTSPSLSSRPINLRKKSILESYSTATNAGAGNSVSVSTAEYGNFSQLEVCWLNIVKGNQIYNIEASESAEGPPSHRISQRLRVRIVNRGIERYQSLTIFYELLNNLRIACNLTGFLPPSMYDLDIRLSEAKPSVDPNRIMIHGIFRYTNDLGESGRPSLGKPSFDGGSLSSPNPSLFQQQQPTASETQQFNPSHLPLGWTNSVSAIEEGSSEGNSRRKKSLLSDLIKRIRKSEYLQNHFAKLLHNLDHCWNLYDPKIEYRRQGIPNDKWRITEVNKNYELSESYPSILVVPAAIDDDTLRKASEFRSKKRFPTLSWLHPRNGCSISRSSQPFAGITYARNENDEKLLLEINRCNRPYVADFQSTASTTPTGVGGSVDGGGTRTPLHSTAPSELGPFIIVDARPAINAKANQALGKGVENEKNYENTTILFMDIPNIHSIRKSLDTLQESLADELKNPNGLELSQWQFYLYRILIASSRIAHCVHLENISILVHCSDGWDRTSQLTSISMVLLDDYYRTLDGFIVLIEKEWLSFGHKFSDRLGWTQEGWKDEERSPIFLQFLDCVHQILRQVPTAFEFNEDLLLFLAEHHCSGFFGNFLFNCEFELKESNPLQYSISIWAMVLANRSQFVNAKDYQPHLGLITPIITKNKMVFWSNYFLKWHDRVWFNHWLSEHNDTEIKRKQEIIWTEDHLANECMKCGSKFSLFRRRHHCRCCGQIFCDPCSHDVRIIPAISRWRALRCCEECAVAIDLTQAEINETNRRSVLARSSERPDRPLTAGSHSHRSREFTAERHSTK